MAVTDAKQAGKVQGDLMKTYKGKFDPAMVKRLIEAELAPK
jgi:Asp-tRNA(Asn)/Glu-tRNA(Gln) amidotransferase B subunit